MPRRTHPFLPGAYYHFYNRGNNRQAIYFESDNYVYFLRGLKKHLLPVLEVVAYCLMPTHYHFLARIRQTSEFFENSEVYGAEVSEAVSQGMMRLGVSYTKAINKRFGRVGALFQGQFQAKPVLSERHLTRLCFYIHGNPVKDGLVSAPEAWPYSNYLEWLELREGTLVDKAFIRERFETPARYRALLEQYLRQHAPEEDLRAHLSDLGVL